MEKNSQQYGLPSRIQLEELGENRLGIRKVVKSRIIQKDAAKIVEIARKIKSVNPTLGVTLICTRNICSKSIALLESEGIEVNFVE
jgi:hypothetical protein